jgi:hypothetical protein
LSGPGGQGIQLTSPLRDMHRQTAKALLLVLLAGTLTPFSAAFSVPPGRTYCHRKPVESSAAEMPCHHHGIAGMHHQEAAGPHPAEQAFDSKSCCVDHQCCRSLVRSQWAQVARQLPGRIANLATQGIQSPHPGFRAVDLALSLPARAPPTL